MKSGAWCRDKTLGVSWRVGDSAFSWAVRLLDLSLVPSNRGGDLELVSCGPRGREEEDDSRVLVWTARYLKFG